MKLSHKTLILLSGMIWMVIGCFLLSLGLGFILESVEIGRTKFEGNFPLVDSLMPYLGGLEQAALILIVFGLFIGYLKGRYVLGKSAVKGVQRIQTFPNPTELSNIYSKKYYILLGTMVGLGMSIKYLGLSSDIRGVVDVIIGSALINGAMLYFRLAFSQPRKSSS